jgi:hypothetical protein
MCSWALRLPEESLVQLASAAAGTAFGCGELIYKANAAATSIGIIVSGATATCVARSRSLDLWAALSLPAACLRAPAACCLLPPAPCPLPPACCPLPAACCLLPAASLPAACCLAACCLLPAASLPRWPAAHPEGHDGSLPRLRRATRHGSSGTPSALTIHTAGDLCGKEALSVSPFVRPADVVGVESGVLLVLALADLDRMRYVLDVT